MILGKKPRNSLETLCWKYSFEALGSASQSDRTDKGLVLMVPSLLETRLEEASQTQPPETQLVPRFHHGHHHPHHLHHHHHHHHLRLYRCPSRHSNHLSLPDNTCLFPGDSFQILRRKCIKKKNILHGFPISCDAFFICLLVPTQRFQSCWW